MFILFAIIFILPTLIGSIQGLHVLNIFRFFSSLETPLPLTQNGALQLCDITQLPTSQTNFALTHNSERKTFFKDRHFKVTASICGHSYPSFFVGNYDEMFGSIVLDSGEAFTLRPDEDGQYSIIERDETWDEIEMDMPWTEMSQGAFSHFGKKRRKLDIIADIIGGGRDYPVNATVCVHFDIGVHINEQTTQEKASQYFVDLVAIITSEAYYEVGFILQACSFSFRDHEIGQDTSTMLEHIQDEQGLKQHSESDLYHHVTSKRLGGGEGYVGGICYREFAYAVSTGLSMNFAIWDQQVVAHEIGHNFGLQHTHDLSPPLDQCNMDCSTMPSEGGTIMSYCHQCGSRQIKFHDLQKPVMIETYQKSEYECMPQFWLWTRISFFLIGAAICLCGVGCWCRFKEHFRREETMHDPSLQNQDASLPQMNAQSQQI